MPDRASLQLGPTLGTKNEKTFILKLLRFLSEIKHVGGWWNLSPPISLELFVVRICRHLGCTSVRRIPHENDSEVHIGAADVGSGIQGSWLIMAVMRRTRVKLPKFQLVNILLQLDDEIHEYSLKECGFRHIVFPMCCLKQSCQFSKDGHPPIHC